MARISRRKVSRRKVSRRKVSRKKRMSFGATNRCQICKDNIGIFKCSKCNHSFCSVCLLDIRSYRENNNGTIYFMCPDCKVRL